MPDGRTIGTILPWAPQGSSAPPRPNGETEIIGAFFNSVTPENQFKWGILHPAPGQWSFAPADAALAFAERHDQQVRGHTLLWHGALPGWVKSSVHSCDAARSILKEHISTLVGQFRGRVAEWDVANEIYEADGTLRPNNPFTAACGDAIVGEAFRWAHEADPQARLYFNDYGVVAGGERLASYLALIDRLRAEAVPLHGFGIQGHLTTDPDSVAGIAGAFDQLIERNLDVRITEADVRLTDAEASTASGLEAQARQYSVLFETCHKREACRGVTLWGITDGGSWVRSIYPDQGSQTVLTQQLTPRPAFARITRVLVDHS